MRVARAGEESATLEIASAPPPRFGRRVNRLVRAFRVLAKNRLALAGLVLLGVFLFTAAFAPWISPYDPLEINVLEARQRPSLEHWMGTDSLGRDVLSRVVHGARIAFLVSVVAVAISASIGFPLGYASGYLRGVTDHIIMRFSDAMLAFPGRLLAIGLVAVFGGGMMSLWLALGISSIPRFARIARAATLEQREREYVHAAHVVGETDTRVIASYIFPNTVAALIVAITLDFASNIVLASGLSFLGLGIPPPAPDWGADLSSAMDGMQLNPWAAVFPGVALSLTVLGFNLVGDGLRDIFDPRHYER